MLSSSSHGQAVSVAGSGSSEGVLTRRMGRETPAPVPQRRPDASASARKGVCVGADFRGFRLSLTLAFNYNNTMSA